MPDQKIDNLLNLALDATEEERQKSGNLNTGLLIEVERFFYFINKKIVASD